MAWAIGAPTCGMLRCGPDHHKHGDPYDVAVAFVARDHLNAEVEGLTTTQPRPSDMRDGKFALAEEGLFWVYRRRKEGRPERIVRGE